MTYIKKKYQRFYLSVDEDKIGPDFKECSKDHPCILFRRPTVGEILDLSEINRESTRDLLAVFNGWIVGFDGNKELYAGNEELFQAKCLSKLDATEAKAVVQFCVGISQPDLVKDVAPLGCGQS